MITTKSILPATLAAALVLIPMSASAQSAAASGQATAAAAATIQGVSARGAEAVIAQLQAQGFRVVETGRTLLGRVRIDAVAEGMVREVVLHQSTGEILSDVVRRIPATASAGANVQTGAGGGLGVNANANANVGVQLGGGGVSAGGGAGVGLGLGN